MQTKQAKTTAAGRGKTPISKAGGGKSGIAKNQKFKGLADNLSFLAVSFLFKWRGSNFV